MERPVIRQCHLIRHVIVNPPGRRVRSVSRDNTRQASHAPGGSEQPRTARATIGMTRLLCTGGSDGGISAALRARELAPFVEVHRHARRALPALPAFLSLAGGADHPRLEIARLRATWLSEVAEAIGLRAFMEAAGITCSQRIGDLVARRAPPDEGRAVALLSETRR